MKNSPANPPGTSGTHPVECHEVLGNEAGRLLAATVAVAHEPARFTDAELHAVFHAWNGLLDQAPELYVTVPEIFAFHQGVLTEFEARCWADHVGAVER